MNPASGPGTLSQSAARPTRSAADATVLRPGQEAGKRLEMAANGFRGRGLESALNRQDTVSAMNA